MDRRAFCAALLSTLAAPRLVNAHLEHRDGVFVIDVRVARETDGVEVMTRTPLDLLSGVGLPLVGERYVDVAAFRQPDPIVGDGRTYEERAVAAVGRAFRIEQGGHPLTLAARAVRLAPGEEASGGAFDPALASLARAPGDAGVPVDAWHGFLDVRFTAQTGRGPVTFVPALGPAVGSMVTFRVFAAGGGEPEMVAGSGEPVQLAAAGSPIR